MGKKTILVISWIGTVVISGVIGFTLARNCTKRALDTTYSSVMYESSAAELNSKINILERLRSKEYIIAINYLENLADVNISYLSLYQTVPTKERNREVIDALKVANTYRKKYSDHQVNPTLSKSVEKALKLAQ
jgi:hypothetical protein